jgi:hypothetical protein
VRSRSTRGEQGAFILLYVFVGLGLLAMAALAIDLSRLRGDRRSDRATADAAAAAGALSLHSAAPGPFNACVAAWTSAARNLGYTPPAAGSTPCSTGGSAITATTTCVDTDPARSVAGTIGPYSITITTPVPDSNPLLNAETAGGDTTQAVRDTWDGTQCDRIGVTVQVTRKSIFAGVVGAANSTTTVHSVARGVTAQGSGANPPALVALNKHDCLAVNAGTGLIEAVNNGTHAGIIQADSDASTGSGSFTCTSNKVLAVTGNGVRIKADPGSDGSAGILAYYASARPTVGYDTSKTGDYVGTLSVLATPITRMPVDLKYHCSAADVPDTGRCAVADDAIQQLMNTYTSGAPPAPYSTFPLVGQSCSAPPPAFTPGNWLINCPSGFTVGIPMLFGGGSIVFTGDVNIVAGGNLLVNSTIVADPVTGLPVPVDDTVDSIVTIRGTSGMTMQSTSASLSMAHTLLYTTQATGNFQGGPTIRWSPPATGDLKGLMMWSEATSTMAFGGGPTFKCDGVVMVPNSLLSIQGSGTLNATNVQFWADRIETQGAAQFILRPDPHSSIATSAAQSRLIR